MMITLFSKNVVHHEQGKKSNLLQVAKKYVIVNPLRHIIYREFFQTYYHGWENSHY